MNSTWPKVSIITPTLNQCQFLEQTILSVLNQNYPNLEYIVMDGGSTDQTLAILKKYRKRIKIFSRPDGSQMEALNKGFRLATGEILGFLNSDDYYLPNSLKKVAESFLSKPQTKILSGDYQIINADGQIIEPWVSSWKRFLRRHHSSQTLAIANYLNQPSTFWHREVYKKVGEFNQQLHYTFDYEFWWRVIEADFKFNFSSEQFSAYRVHAGSKGGLNYRERSVEELGVQQKFAADPALTFSHFLHNQLMIWVYALSEVGLFKNHR